MCSTSSQTLLGGAARQVVAAMMVVLLCAASAAAADEAKAAATADLQAIRAAVTSYVAAYNRGDAAAVAAHWSETGQWIGPGGERIQGREAIAQAMQVMFAEGGAGTVEVTDPQVRLVSGDVAVEEGVARLTRPGEPPSTSNYIALHVKKGGQWKLDSIRETESPSDSEATDNLKQLEWLVGEWVDESPDAVVEHACRWSEDGHFLLGEFTVRLDERPALKGTLRIGWDPVRQQIRSWAFDTEGGFSEGYWTSLGDRWVVKTTGVRADGTTASATNSYIPLRRDAYLLTSVDRIVGDEQELDQTITVVRKPPKPGK